MSRLVAKPSGYPVSGLCRLFGVSKQAYYKHKGDSLAKVIGERFIVEFVNSVRQVNKGIGGEKLWLLYREYFGQRYSVGRDAFKKILAKNELLVRKKRKRVRTTNSSHPYAVYPNLIKDLIIDHPDQVWVSDITYIRTQNGFCFLSLITDAYTRGIVGYQLAPGLDAIHTVNALQGALREFNGNPPDDLIHHSDRGIQYASVAYTGLLHTNRIRISMSAKGDPKENAIAERVNGILKQEFLNHITFKDIHQVKQVLDKAIEFYNNTRPHRSLDMLTPAQAAKTQGRIKKRWKSYRDDYLLTKT